MKSAITTTECGGCSLTDRWVLHNVRHRGIYRRLCTSCVLKLHPGSFCPICFEFYDSPPPPHLRSLCQKCPSVSHQHCVASHSDSFVCPPCLNPTFSFFDPNRKPKDAQNLQPGHRYIDISSSGVVVCAARIASLSMKKAMVASRGEAERRVKEATFTKKRARECLQQVSSTAAKEKLRSVVVDVKDKIGKGNCIVGGAGVTLAERDRYPSDDREDVLDNSCEISANLEDKERIIGFRAQSMANGVSMSTEDKERGRVIAGSGMGRPSLQNNISVNEKERSGTLAHYNGLEEKANKTVPFVEGHFHHLQGRNSSQ